MAGLAVIITTYNWPAALEAVLAGYLSQQRPPDELIVADDGSTEETRAVIDKFRDQAPFPVKHVWHADEGFRAGAIRNRAIQNSEADYIIFTDGDCIPAPWFLQQHQRLADQGWFLSGNRVLLSQNFSQEVLQEKIPIHTWTRRQWFQARRRKQINRLLPLFRIPLGRWYRRRLAKAWEGAKTCNLSVWKEDLLAVNGFDEDYTGWGMEDSDLVLRLIRNGVYHQDARFAAPVFHLWHSENSRDQLEENQRRLQQLIETDRIQARVGIKQASSE
ncbi:glycosyltransferase family 2 protein [uncultured Gimesia sp.]|uniref:glycosyltransferase family 2 protein n=1 Tax=uncultured Gimesia sp. TaxID=1678688 RepID=UPI0030D9A4C9|tara:strand:- start:33891 stop:34712 length:822 start_codon:yes stop_codon:yes gene_type:complete